MRIKKGDRTAGLDSLKLRDYLRKYGDQRIYVGSVADKFALSEVQAETMIEELVMQDLICRSELQLDKATVCYETTIKGNAFGLASAAKPVSRVSVEKTLQDFIGRVRAINERQDLAYRIESVIVFGSYLSETPLLNDLDVSAEPIGKWTDAASYEAACRDSRGRARASGRQFRNVLDEVSWPRTEVLLLLKSRSRTISLCDWDSLGKMPKFKYRVLLGNPAKIAAFIKDGGSLD
jgi:hypothetical protein